MKEKEQSLPEIYQTHGPEMPVSIVTLYSYIDRMTFSTIRNIDLAKKAKYPASYKKEGGGADQQGVPKQQGTRPQRVPIHQAGRGRIDT